MNTRITRFLFCTAIASAIAVLLLVLPVPTRTVSSAPVVLLFNEVPVNTTTDEYNTSGTGTGCSLREAIKSLNDSVDFGGCARIPISGPKIILLPSGTYTLTIAGAGEDLDATGDLDILQSVIISATGATAPTVVGGAGWTDRIFHVLTGTVIFKGFAIQGGNAGGAYGGGVRIESVQSLTFNDGTVSGNSGFYGGGIYNEGTLTLTNVTLSGNDSTDGGGIYNSGGTATLTNVTLSGNSGFDGGGIINLGTATLTNVTLSGNTATYGGGIYNDGALVLTNVTFSGNSATGNGGGIYVYGGTAILTNTIVANSPSSENCQSFISLGGSFNLSSDGTCGFGAGRDNVNVMLAPLGNYGGSTLTHIPLPGSPAINFGTNTGCPSTDQRGKTRPVNTCDVGAVERQLVDYVFLYLPLIVR